MSEKGGFKEIWPIIFLGIVVCLSVTLLTLTGNVTKDKIDEVKRQEVADNLKKIFPDMDDYDNLNDRDEYNTGGVYLIIDKDADTADKEIGIGIKCVGSGYGGDIEMLVGLSVNLTELLKTDLADITIKGLKILEPISETPGLGAKILDNKFQGYFEMIGFSDVKLEEDGGEISAITGATISSKAVVEGIRDTIEDKVNDIKESQGVKS